MYAKVYAALWDGSMAADPFDTWALFVFLLAHADREGFVEMTPDVIARRSGIPLDLVKAGIARLEAPDPRSRSREHDGRRLEPIDDRGWGWRIVNYTRYRTLQDEDQRREQNRQAQMRRRERLRQQASAGVSDPSAAVSTSQQRSAHAEADAEAEAEAEADAEHTRPPDGGHASDSPSANGKADPKAEWIEGFEASFWPEYPRKVARKAALKAWLGIKPHSQDRLDEVCAGLDRWLAYWRDHDTPADKIPHPATWLHQERWESVG